MWRALGSLGKNQGAPAQFRQTPRPWPVDQSPIERLALVERARLAGHLSRLDEYVTELIDEHGLPTWDGFQLGTSGLPVPQIKPHRIGQPGYSWKQSSKLSGRRDGGPTGV